MKRNVVVTLVLIIIAALFFVICNRENSQFGKPEGFVSPKPAQTPQQFVLSNGVYGMSSCGFVEYDADERHYTIIKKSKLAEEKPPFTSVSHRFGEHTVAYNKEEGIIYFYLNEPGIGGTLYAFNCKTSAPGNKENGVRPLLSLKDEYIANMAAYKNNLVISTYSGKLYVSRNSGNNFTEINSANVLNEFPGASPVATDILRYPIVIGTDNLGELFIVNPFYEHFILFSRDFLNSNLALIELDSDGISSNFTVALARIKKTNAFIAFMAPFNYIAPSQYATPLLFEFELPESGKSDVRVTGKVMKIGKDVTNINDVVYHKGYAFLASNNGIWFTPVKREVNFRKVSYVKGNIGYLYFTDNDMLYFTEIDMNRFFIFGMKTGIFNLKSPFS